MRLRKTCSLCVRVNLPIANSTLQQLLLMAQQARQVWMHRTHTGAIKLLRFLLTGNPLHVKHRSSSPTGNAVKHLDAAWLENSRFSLREKTSFRGAGAMGSVREEMLHQHVVPNEGLVYDVSHDPHLTPGGSKT